MLPNALLPTGRATQPLVTVLRHELKQRVTISTTNFRGYALLWQRLETPYRLTENTQNDIEWQDHVREITPLAILL